jgi:hypothetical protein
MRKSISVQNQVKAQYLSLVADLTFTLTMLLDASRKVEGQIPGDLKRLFA